MKEKKKIENEERSTSASFPLRQRSTSSSSAACDRLAVSGAATDAGAGVALRAWRLRLRRHRRQNGRLARDIVDLPRGDIDAAGRRRTASRAGALRSSAARRSPGASRLKWISSSFSPRPSSSAQSRSAWRNSPMKRAVIGRVDLSQGAEERARISLAEEVAGVRDAKRSPARTRSRRSRRNRPRSYTRSFAACPARVISSGDRLRDANDRIARGDGASELRFAFSFRRTSARLVMPVGLGDNGVAQVGDSSADHRGGAGARQSGASKSGRGRDYDVDCLRASRFVAPPEERSRPSWTFSSGTSRRLGVSSRRRQSRRRNPLCPSNCSPGRIPTWAGFDGDHSRLQGNKVRRIPAAL